MKLSEAIRLGAMMGPQYFGDAHGPNHSMCANAGALKAAGAVDVFTEWPWLWTSSQCPACWRADVIAGVIATCLNDRHRWSRERIADWVATVEPQDEQTDGWARDPVCTRSEFVKA